LNRNTVIYAVLAVLTFIGLFALGYRIGKNIISAKVAPAPDYQAPAVLSLSPAQAVVAGTPLIFSFSIPDNLNITEPVLYYAIDLEQEQEAIPEIVEGKVTFTIDTDLDAQYISYYFTYISDGIEYRFPETETIHLELIPNIESLNPSDIDIEISELTEVISNNAIDVSVNISKQYDVSKVIWQYTYTDQWQELELFKDGESDFTGSLELNGSIPNFQYNFKIIANDKELLFPDIPLRLDTSNNPYFKELTDKITQIGESNGINLSVTYLDEQGNSFNYRGAALHDTLSTAKVMIMVETYRQLNEGIIKLSDPVSRFGYSGTVEGALRSMMHYSSNSASGALVKKVGGADNINSTIQSYLGDNTALHFDHTPIYQGQDGENTGWNTLTTDSMTTLIDLIAKGQVINEEVSSQMISLMSGCSDYFKIKSIAHSGEIAMKTGYQPTTHYALTVFIAGTDGRKYTLTIFAGKNSGTRQAIVKEIVELINEYHENGLI